MRKIKPLFAFALALVILISFSACRETAEHMEFELNSEKTAYTLAYYTDTTSVKTLVIPDEFNGLPVTKIKRLAVSAADTLETIVIGKNISEIDDWGITGCLHLKRFEVDPENTSFCAVDGVLFTKDMKTLVYYPNANTAVYAAGGALEKKADYVIPDGVETISKCAFYKCYALQSVTLPDSVKVIGERAFHKCENLQSVNFPEGLTTIEFDAFIGCTGLTRIELPATLSSIGEFAFYNASNIKEVVIHSPKENVTLGKKWEPSSTGRPTDAEIFWAEEN